MPKTDKRYKIFTKSKRDKLEALYNAGIPVKKIAVELGYTFQSIYRELKRGYYMHRNTDWTETQKYSADKAQYHADLNATAKGAPLKIGNDHVFAKFVEDMILEGYSPAAILDYIRENGLKFKTKVCRVTLYSYIDKGLFLRISNKQLLHKGNRKKKHKKAKEIKQIPKFEHSIEKRPAEVAERNTFGHWEMDTVVGSRTKGETLLVMTERLTRMELIFKAPDKTAASTVMMLNRLESKLGNRDFCKMFKSITCDNGVEFSNIAGMEYSPLTGKKRTMVYFCHPYCSSERGSNENQNGFIRRFVPKKTSISSYSKEYLKHVQDFINTYPRRIFDGENALKRFKNELQKLNIKKIF
ncbi:MAG: IS30 family transposase [Clostridia bacterium]|nr:IS30 family transposase [Clostridia bacterium]